MLNRNFTRIPPTLSPEELLDVAFGRATKAGRAERAQARPVRRLAKGEEARIKAASLAVRGNLGRFLDRAPRINALSPFYRELIALLFDIDRYEASLGAMEVAIRKVAKLEARFLRMLRAARKNEERLEARRAFYGRTASLLRSIRDELAYLEECRKKFRELPVVEDEFTVVIAGAPNVGKSTLLKAMTAAKPRIESYPFTTKQLLLGYFERKHERYQVFDTPGLLDRPLAERNPFELQAILALKHLADVLIYMFDPTEASGFSLKEQISIYRDLASRFEVDVLAVVNKVDLIEEPPQDLLKALNEKAFLCSAQEKTGVEELIAELVRLRAGARG